MGDRLDFNAKHRLNKGLAVQSSAFWVETPLTALFEGIQS
jgi:hypothetical protein